MSTVSKISCLIIALLSAIILTSCSRNTPSNSPAAISSTYYGLKTADGKDLVLKAPPQKIVSLALRADDIALALVGTKRILAFCKYADNPLISNIPAEAAKQVKYRSEPSLEYLLKLQPDLVIVPESQSADLIYSLRKLGIPVYVSRTAHNIADVQTLILDLGRVVSEQEKSQALITLMHQRLARIQKAVAKIPVKERPVVYRLSISGGNGGKGSSYDDVCQKAGVINGAAQMHLWGTQLLPKEQIVKINPDIIFLPDWDWRGGDVDHYIEECVHDPALQSVKAIKTRRLYKIPDKHMLCSSQYIVDCVEDIYQACYGPLPK